MSLKTQINSLLVEIRNRKIAIEAQKTTGGEGGFGKLNLVLLEGRLADLIAQLPTDVQENNLIEEKKTSSLLISALIIGILVLT